MSKFSERFIHPVSKKPLLIKKNGSLSSSEEPNISNFIKYGKIYDFVMNEKINDDRLYYDHLYRQLSITEIFYTVENLKNKWNEESGFKLLIKKIGNIKNKKVLLLGNGLSLKEFYFLVMGAKVIYTDLSIKGILQIYNFFSASVLAQKYCEKIEFHAVDALHLPFHDQSFDVIYGCAFVHHIQKLEKFFGEVNRCLKKGGICIFFDDAYSPIWHNTKNTILKPLQKFSHRKTGISPEDKVATEKGGFKKKEVEHLMKKNSFNHLIFERVSFFEYLIRRFHKKIKIPCVLKFLPCARFIDQILKEKTSFIDKQGIRLVWGFIK